MVLQTMFKSRDFFWPSLGEDWPSLTEFEPQFVDGFNRNQGQNIKLEMLTNEMPSFERSSDGYILIKTDVSQFRTPINEMRHSVIHETCSPFWFCTFSFRTSHG